MRVASLVRRSAWAAVVVGAGALGLWLYVRYVWYAGPSITWNRGNTEFELLSPRMLGIALLAPYFLWMIGRSLADLPPAQRALSLVLRVAFVTVLALGLARLARTATTQKVCTVYVVDVSDSVADAALYDARAEVQRGLDAKRGGDLVRLVTFAKRPRVVPVEDGAKVTAPAVERHEAQPVVEGMLGEAHGGGAAGGERARHFERRGEDLIIGDAQRHQADAFGLGTGERFVGEQVVTGFG